MVILIEKLWFFNSCNGWSGILLRIKVSWLWEEVQKTLKKRRNQTEKKHWKVKRKKNEEYEESPITTIYIFGFKLYFARKHSMKKSCLHLYTMKFYLQFLCVAGYLKHSNDTWKLNIHKYTNYNIIEMYINRLKPDSHLPKKFLFICLDESPLKMMKNAFCFTLKALFVLKIFKCLS